LEKEKAMVLPPQDQPEWPAPAAEEHGPLRAERIPRGQYDKAFLDGLQVNGQVHVVGPDWKGDVGQLPPEVTWILHPNGDLERVGFN
jgi:hypothetical protein